MEQLIAYLPMDRLQAISQGLSLPEQAQGAALFADISGFTPLTEALLHALGPRRGADELTHQLNLVYNVLVEEVHRYRGSVLTFSGDAITCWFEETAGLTPAVQRAVAGGLAMQQAMQQFATIAVVGGGAVSLGMKVAVAAGPARRFLIGDPEIQFLDVIAGATLERMAATEQYAERGEVVVDEATATQLSAEVQLAAWRQAEAGPDRYAVVAGLNRPVESLPWPPLQTTPPDSALKPWLLSPVYERIHGGQGAFLAEIRPAVILFLRFGGLNYEQDETAGHKLDAYTRWAQQVLRRYQGYLLQLTIGDKGSYLYAAFGALALSGDEAEQAVAAALELVSPPLDFIQNTQIGLSQGRVRVGAYGGDARRTYGVLGDEVNTAARLMGTAQPGQIRVSQRIAEAARRNYHLEYLGPVKLKGKQHPLPVWTALEPKLSAAPQYFLAHPLVGREAELAQMKGLLAAGLNGTGQILRLEGEAGLGKSHLTAELVRQAGLLGYQTLLAACQSWRKETPYEVWRQLFRALLELTETPSEGQERLAWRLSQAQQVNTRLTQLNPAWQLRLPLLGDVLDLPLADNETTAAFEPQLRQQALFSLVVDIIQNWPNPLLLVIEDAHWLDAASQELTLAVARSLGTSPIVLMLVQRPAAHPQDTLLPDLAQLPGASYLHLAELGPESMAALAAHRLQGTPSPLLLGFIQLQAKGNPFFAEELIDALREAGDLTHQNETTWTLSERLVGLLHQANCLRRDESGQWLLNPDAPLSPGDLGLPDSVHGLVLARLDRLLEAHKLTLKVASVIGRIFEFELLTQAHPLENNQEDLLGHLEVVAQREFTRLETPLPRLIYIFKHNITRDVAYNTLLAAQQRQLHLLVAEALETLAAEAIEPLAYHYSRAGAREKALFYLDKAAAKAQREYANETALNYYNQALGLEEGWVWRKGQLEILHILGRRQEERAALEQMEALYAGEQDSGRAGGQGKQNFLPAAFEVAYLWGQYYEALGDYPQAQAAIERALLASQEQPLQQARCLSQFGRIVHQQGDYQQAQNWYRQCLDILAGGLPATTALEAVKVQVNALNGLGIIYRQQGVFNQARQQHEQAATISRSAGYRQGEAQALNDLGATAFYQRHFDEALTHYRQALEIRRAIGDRAGEGKNLYNLAMVTRDAGDYGQTQSYLQAALTILQATGNRWDEVNVWNELGILYHEVGRLSQATAYLQHGLQLSRLIGDDIGQAYLLANLGLVAHDGGELALAAATLQEGLALAEKHQDKHSLAYLLGYLSRVNLRSGNVAQALAQALSTLQLHREANALLLTADDLATLAEIHLVLADLPAALTYSQQALAILQGCGGQGPEFAARDYFVCYRVFNAAGQTQSANEALQPAYQLVMAKADKIIDPALRRSFLEQVPLHQEIVAAFQFSHE